MSQSAVVNPITCLPKIANYEDFFGLKNSPNGRFYNNLGTLAAIKSSLNRRYTSLQDSFTGAPGKRRTVILEFDNPLCISVCAKDFECDKDKVTYGESVSQEQFTIDTRYTTCKNGEEAALMLAFEDFAAWCERDEMSKFTEKVMEVDRKFLVELNKIVLDMVVSRVVPANYRQWKMFVNNPLTNTPQINFNPKVAIEKLMVEAQMDINDYMLVGGSIITQLELLGFNMIPMFKDYSLDAKIGENAFMLIPAGAFQLVEWFDFVSPSKKKDLEALKRGTKSVPMMGVNGEMVTQEVDYEIRIDHDCDKIMYNPSVYMELFKAIPGGCDTDQDGIFIIENCGDAFDYTC
jgi:hypothetical protein